MADGTAARLRAAAAAGSAARVADELVALFELVEAMPDKMQWVARQLSAGPDGDAALARACAEVAAAIDADPASFDRHGYHNRQHFCEVALTAWALCLLDGLDGESTQLALLAALVHDVVHEGRPNAPFLYERASIAHVEPLLREAGVTTPQIDRLRVLVLATDPVVGTAFMATCCQAGANPAVPAAAPELAALTGDADLARLARLVCEADVLPSMGLGTGHALRVQQRLAREWQRPLDSLDKLGFVDRVLAQGYIGPVFLPQVHALRETLSLHAFAAV